MHKRQKARISIAFDESDHIAQTTNKKYPAKPGSVFQTLFRPAPQLMGRLASGRVAAGRWLVPGRPSFPHLLLGQVAPATRWRSAVELGLARGSNYSMLRRQIAAGRHRHSCGELCAAGRPGETTGRYFDNLVIILEASVRGL
jgi:hypothetical protein